MPYDLSFYNTTSFEFNVSEEIFRHKLNKCIKYNNQFVWTFETAYNVKLIHSSACFQSK